MTPLEHAAVGIGIAGLKALASKLLKKLPKWLRKRDQEQKNQEIFLGFQRLQERDLDVILRFESALRYALKMADRAQERQSAVIEQQRALVVTLLSSVLEALEADERGAGGVGSGARVIESVTSAHEALVATFEQAQPTTPAVSLEVVARWQMTYAPSFRMSDRSLQCGERTILACVREQYIYYLSLSGADPATAAVNYRVVMLTKYPTSECAWDTLLEEGSGHLDQFLPLPGEGIAGLATRLERYAFRD